MQISTYVRTQKSYVKLSGLRVQPYRLLVDWGLAVYKGIMLQYTKVLSTASHDIIRVPPYLRLPSYPPNRVALAYESPPKVGAYLHCPPAAHRRCSSELYASSSHLDELCGEQRSRAHGLGRTQPLAHVPVSPPVPQFAQTSFVFDCSHHPEELPGPDH